MGEPRGQNTDATRAATQCRSEIIQKMLALLRNIWEPIID